jgi:hypothetical protein
MKTKLVLACASLLALLPATGLAVPTVYSYTGPFYSEIIDSAYPGTYTTSMRVTGLVTFAEKIAPNTIVNIALGNPSVLSYGFNDGRFDYNLGNVYQGQLVFETDASGGVAEWFVSVNIAPAPGVPNSHASTRSNPCNASNVCDAAYVQEKFNYDRANVYGAGSWTVTAIPEPQTYALFLAGIALVGFAAHRRSNLPT